MLCCIASPLLGFSIDCTTSLPLRVKNLLPLSEVFRYTACKTETHIMNSNAKNSEFNLLTNSVQPLEFVLQVLLPPVFFLYTIPQVCISSHYQFFFLYLLFFFFFFLFFSFLFFSCHSLSLPSILYFSLCFVALLAIYKAFAYNFDENINCLNHVVPFKRRLAR